MALSLCNIGVFFCADRAGPHSAGETRRCGLEVLLLTCLVVASCALIESANMSHQMLCIPSEWIERTSRAGLSAEPASSAVAWRAQLLSLPTDRATSSNSCSQNKNDRTAATGGQSSGHSVQRKPHQCTTCANTTSLSPRTTSIGNDMPQSKKAQNAVTGTSRYGRWVGKNKTPHHQPAGVRMRSPRSHSYIDWRQADTAERVAATDGSAFRRRVDRQQQRKKEAMLRRLNCDVGQRAEMYGCDGGGSGRASGASALRTV